MCPNVFIFPLQRWQVRKYTFTIFLLIFGRHCPFQYSPNMHSGLTHPISQGCAVANTVLTKTGGSFPSATRLLDLSRPPLLWLKIDQNFYHSSFQLWNQRSSKSSIQNTKRYFTNSNMKMFCSPKCQIVRKKWYDCKMELLLFFSLMTLITRLFSAYLVGPISFFADGTLEAN